MISCTKTVSLLAAALVFTSFQAHAEQIVFTEIMYNPSGATGGEKAEFIEIKNITGTPRDMAKWKFSAGITYQFPDFNSGSTSAHILGAFEKIIVSSKDPATTRAEYPFIPAGQRVFGPWTAGSLDNTGETIALDDKNGVTQCKVDYDQDGRWPVGADGTGHSLQLRNENVAIDEAYNWRMSTLNRSGVAGASTSVAVFADTWKYTIPSSDPGTSWRTVGFNDGSWLSGPGIFGHETATLSQPINTTVGTASSGVMTYLFRKTFTYNGTLSGASISIDHLIDDGVTFYLNGQLLGSVNHTPGAWDNSANIAADNATQANVTYPANGLVVGTNVLCAEVHQYFTSSDMVFGAQASIVLPAPGMGTSVAGSVNLRLSEVHYGTNGIDWVEVQNFGGSNHGVDGLFISTKANFTDRKPLTGTINAGAHASFTFASPFPTDPDGDKVYLIDGAFNVLSAADLKRIPGRDSMQAVYPVVPASRPAWEIYRREAEWFSSTTSTQNGANNPPINNNVVINEIMCDPMSEQAQAEYIELHNKSGSPVSLTDWELKGGVDMYFPSGATIPANGYVLVGGNKAYLESVYPGVTVYGNWSGKLGNKGDKLRLKDQYGNLADEVNYKTGGDWPDFSLNKGSSMELINPTMDNNRASAWRASDETAKGQWGQYSITGTYQELFDRAPWHTGSIYDFANEQAREELTIQLSKDGHTILRNIQVRDGGGNNMISANVNAKSNNGSSSSGWLVQGTHAESYVDGEGLHVVADGHGDHRPNHCEIDCTGINNGGTYTIQFEARWVCGTPRLLAYLWGNSIGKAFYIDVPNNLGSAGSSNSRYNSNAPAQVDSMIHSPAVPDTSDDVKVTARIFSATTLGSVELRVREDNINNSNAYQTINMVDNGTNGDSTANDGLYTALVTNHKVDGRRVQFYIKATATNGQATYQPAPGSTRPGMWIVDNRNIPTDLRRQRFIQSAYDLEQMRTNTNPYGGARSENGYKYGRLSNHYFPMTFIHNETDVYYMAEMHEGGSRWHRTTQPQLKAGKWKLPDDRAFRGRTKCSYDHDTDYGMDYSQGDDNQKKRGPINTRMVGYLLYLCGYEASNDEEFTYTINTRNDYPLYPYDVKTDCEVTDNELIQRSFKDGGDGEMWEVSEVFYYNDNYGDTFGISDWEHKGTDESVRYWTEYPMRMREQYWDYSPLINMFKVVGDSNSSRDLLERTIDTNAMMREQAVRGVCGDWDSAFGGGKNGYLYRKPTSGKMIPVNWDNDAAFSPNDGSNAVLGGQTPPTPGSPNPNANSRPFYGMYVDKPWVRRAVNYYLTELIDNYAKGDSQRTIAWLNAQKNAVQPALNHRNGMSWPDSGTPGASHLGEQQNLDAHFDINFYLNWFSNRRQVVLDTINQSTGGGNGSSYNTTFQINSNDGTDGSTVNLRGQAPSKAYDVIVDNHPEAVMRWDTQTNFKLSNIILKSGTNNFVLRMVDLNGAQIGNPINYSVNKAGNVAPFMVLNSDPGSGNVMLGQKLKLDASTSIEPDNSAITFTWAVSPSTGVTLTTPGAIPANSRREATFLNPGIYAVTVTGSDSSAATASRTREFAVANSQDFSPFTTGILESYWIAGGMENRDSASLSRWYSLYDIPGKLVIQVLDNSPKPLTHGNEHPNLLRNMPSDADCAILTDLTLETRKSGSFFTGLYLETSEGKYAFGLENGTQISAKRSTGSGFSNITSPQGSLGSDAKLRIRRVGLQLRFERCTDDVWSTLFTHTMGANSTLSKGGVFSSTSQSESFRVSFDYVLVVDPNNGRNNSIRITEVMYHPQAPGTVEFIEFQNTSASPVNIGGFSFDQGDPVDAFTLASRTLNPGQYAVVTNNLAAFQARYGTGPIVAGVWPGGALKNEGESIKMRDNEGNLIHDFNYLPTAPWPTAGAGMGSSIEVVNLNADYNLGTNWIASAVNGGTPGAGGTPPPPVDSDGDGYTDDFELKYGTDPNNATSRLVMTSRFRSSGKRAISFSSAPGTTYRVEYRNDLTTGSWQTLTLEGGGTTIVAAGATTEATDDTAPASLPAKRFYRIIAQ